jgi:hypothetical protein
MSCPHRLFAAVGDSALLQRYRQISAWLDAYDHCDDLGKMHQWYLDRETAIELESNERGLVRKWYRLETPDDQP